MIRPSLSVDADRDLDEIRLYLETLPREPAKNILSNIKRMLRLVAENPYLGQTHSDLTLIAGVEIRSRLCGPYRIYYRADHSIPEVFAIRHTARNNPVVLASRLQ